MKCVRKDEILDYDKVDSMLQEKQISNEVRHPFIVNVDECFQTDIRLYFIMRFVRGGQLTTHLKKAEKFSEQRVKNYIVQLALCLGHLHSKNIVYRDLKLENILLGEDGFLNLVDFGCCRRLQADELAHSMCGTFDYLAPEMIKEEGHNHTLDWWTLGIATYEMLVGLPPFYVGIHDQSNSKTKEMILKKDVTFPTKKKHGFELSKNAKDFIQKLLNKNPKKRLGAKNDVEEVLNHKWLSDVDRFKMLAKDIQIPHDEKPELMTSMHDLRYFNMDLLAMPIRDTKITLE